MPFFAYLLYAGHSDNIEQRMGQHQSGALGGYTHSRRPVTLVWFEEFPSRDQAFACEWRIKGWSRAKKEALIAGDWDRVSALAKGRSRTDK